MKWYDSLLVAVASGAIYFIVTVFIGGLWFIMTDEDTDTFFFFGWCVGGNTLCCHDYSYWEVVTE